MRRTVADKTGKGSVSIRRIRRIRVIRILLMRSLLQAPIADAVYTIENRSRSPVAGQDFLIASGAPQFDGAVFAARRQRLSIRRERHAINGVCVAV
jgi:hypothetical protein